MIRDPSDGSVREKRPDDKQDVISSGPVIGTGTSGLPITKNADQLARLERDREWLKNYMHRKSEGK